MTSINRETVRDALTSLLSTALVGTGKPVQAVYGYQPGTFGNASPVVAIASAGTEPEQRAVTSRQKNNLYFNIYSFVAYAVAGTTWGEDDAEDRLDLIEKTIRDTISTNLSTSNWAFIEYDGRSVTDSVLVGGVEYRREIIPIRIEAYDN